MKTHTITPAVVVRWILGSSMVVAMIAATILYYRYTYTRTKRLRVVVEGKFYRAGRMSCVGLDEALKRYKIRTVINLMDEEQDPQLRTSYFNSVLGSEKEVCKRNGARYVFVPVEVVPRKYTSLVRPRTIDRFLEIMDDPNNYPVLLHCRAGLHRTGILSAIYRMEYQGWSPTHAWHELRYLGFGEGSCFSDNQYISQYVFEYQPGYRRPSPMADYSSTPLDSLIQRTKFDGSATER